MHFYAKTVGQNLHISKICCIFAEKLRISYEWRKRDRVTHKETIYKGTNERVLRVVCATIEHPFSIH